MPSLRFEIPFTENHLVIQNRFDEVVFLDDFFRSTDNGLGYTSQRPNRWFLRELFGVPCRRAGVQVREESAQSDGGRIPVAQLMQQLGLAPCPAGWAAACSANLNDALSQVGPLTFGPRSLIIGWGLPPSLLNYIDHCGASFMDIEVDPLRFSRHLYLRARSNDDQIRRTLEGLCVSTEVFWSAAAHVKAYFARRGSEVLFTPSTRVGLFAGQTELDLALVRDGELVAPMDFFDTVSAWAKEVDVLLVKRHPYAQESGHVEELVKCIPNAIPTELNVYSIFWAKNLQFVAALSSGVLNEAKYFGLESRRLMVPDRANAAKLPASTSAWFTLTAEVASLQVIKQMTQTRSDPWEWFRRRMGSRPLESPDTLDLLFGARWGLDMNAPGLPEHPLLEVGRQYVLAEFPAFSSWLGVGWHSPEGWGVWSMGARCQLVLPLDPAKTPAARALALSMCLQTLPGDPAPATVLSLEVNGEDLFPTLDRVGDLLNFSVEVPCKVWLGRPALLISLRISGAKRPIDLHGHADQRVLGVGLLSLTTAAVSPSTTIGDPDIGSPTRVGNAAPDPVDSGSL